MGLLTDLQPASLGGHLRSLWSRSDSHFSKYVGHLQKHCQCGPWTDLSYLSRIQFNHIKKKKKSGCLSTTTDMP